MDTVIEALYSTVPWTLGGTALFVVIMHVLTWPFTGRSNMSQKEYELYKERRTTHNDSIVQDDKGAVDMAGIALKTAILLNGTTAAATLAFIGRLWGHEGNETVIAGLVAVLALLLAGAFCGSVATPLAYLRMYFSSANWDIFVNHGKNSSLILIAGNVVQGIAFFLVVESHVLFVLGMARALKALGL